MCAVVSRRCQSQLKLVVAILLRYHLRDTGDQLVAPQSPLKHLLGEEARVPLLCAVFGDQVLDNGVLAVQIQSANGAIQAYRWGPLSLRTHRHLLVLGVPLLGQICPPILAIVPRAPSMELSTKFSTNFRCHRRKGPEMVQRHTRSVTFEDSMKHYKAPLS